MTGLSTFPAEKNAKKCHDELPKSATISKIPYNFQETGLSHRYLHEQMGGMMLAAITSMTSLVSSGATLWLSLYLFARGYPNRVTMRAVLSLLAISVFFLGTYNSFFVDVPGSASLRAALLIIGMTCWYSTTFQLPNASIQTRFRWAEIGLYGISLITVILLIATQAGFSREAGNPLYVAYVEGDFVHSLYGLTQILISVGLLFNLLADRTVRFSSQGRFFLLASIFPTLAVLYGMVAFILIEPPLPRVVQDAFVFCGVFLLGLSVARHQTLIERRMVFQDFPILALAMTVLVALYISVGMQVGLPARSLGYVITFAILSHSLYDVIREFLERLRLKSESMFRKQIRLMETRALNESDKLHYYLQEGLEHLCKTLHSNSGMIALLDGENFVTAAGRNSVDTGNIVNNFPIREEVFRLESKISNIEWLTASFEGQKAIALVGIGSPNSKLEYSSGELDLLAEFADHVGTIASMSHVQGRTGRQTSGTDRNQTVVELSMAADDMFENLDSNPEEPYLRTVEESLRKYSDVIVLGQSQLADWVGADGNTHIERGKHVQKVLFKAIEALRPTEARPPEPLPRIWYNYIVLHDAYVKGVINREVMARLYISEGTFNRTRRNALRGVTRWLLEEYRIN
jgi:hypothetical protein